MSPPVQELPTAYKPVRLYRLPLARTAGTCPRPTEAVSFIVVRFSHEDCEERRRRGNLCSLSLYIADCSHVRLHPQYPQYPQGAHRIRSAPSSRTAAQGARRIRSARSSRTAAQPRLVPRLAMTRGETLRCFHTHDTLVPPSLLALPYFSAFLSIDSCAKDGYNSIISYNKTGCVAMPKQKGK